MPSVRRPVIGLIAQIVLLAVLALNVGLGAAGWSTGLAYGLVTCVALARGMRLVGIGEFGPADQVTLIRATLVGGVTALTIDSFQRPAAVGTTVTLAVVALALDAVDGFVARRTGTASALGARFDMEIDAFLILVLSLYVARSMGIWVLAIGGMRYAFVAATWALPWMRASLPQRYWAKVVAAIQGVVLVIAAADVFSVRVTGAALAASLALLAASFGWDIAWLWRTRRSVSRYRGGGNRPVRRNRAAPRSRSATPVVRR